jgi:putative ABC transport system substrate-binding protein
MLPAAYAVRYFVTGGGLVLLLTRSIPWRAASYVDRILKGENRQTRRRCRLNSSVINLKTAKALGLEVPSTLLARADEVIE